MQLKKELNTRKDRVNMIHLCAILGLYSHLTRSFRHLNSGGDMKARLVRPCCAVSHTNVLNLNEP